MHSDPPSALLDRVRKQLAKAAAEGVTPPEAEALTAKAAELMARYGIDRARLAISSAAFAVSASASGGVTPSASALASSLRTRSSRALGGSERISNLQIDPSRTQYRTVSPPYDIPAPHRRPASRHSTLDPYHDRSDLAEHLVR